MKVKKSFKIIAVLAVMCIIFSYGVKLSEKNAEVTRETIKEYAEEAGLEGVLVEQSENYGRSFNLYCDNFDKVDFNNLINMDKLICDMVDVATITYHQGNTTYKIQQNFKEITASSPNGEVEYRGSWDDKYEDSKSNFDYSVNSSVIIASKKCDICGKQAKECIGDEYYCSTHYEEAFEWYVEQAIKSLG